MGAALNSLRERRSDGALNLSSLEARSANIQSLGSALDDGAHTLDVRVPTAAGAHVGVRDALTEGRVLAADLTYRCHGSLL